MHPPLPFDRWPAADREAWATALAPRDLFADVPGRAEHWRPATVTLTLRGYGVWLAWLCQERSLQPGLTGRDLADHPRLRQYRRALNDAGLSAKSVMGALGNLARALKAMYPHGDWGWISKAASRIRATAPASAYRPRGSGGDLVRVGEGLMAQAEREDRWSLIKRAVLYRDGLMIALLASRPVRLSNLTSIALDRHLFEEGPAFQVRFPSQETKTKRELAFAWPPRLNEALRRHLQHYRPGLVARGDGTTDALWVSWLGTPLAKDWVSTLITKRTEASGGEPLSPHKFRHVAATTIAVSAPDNISDAARILGHATLATTERYYNRARMLDAAERFQAAIGRR